MFAIDQTIEVLCDALSVWIPWILICGYPLMESVNAFSKSRIDATDNFAADLISWEMVATLMRFSRPMSQIFSFHLFNKAIFSLSILTSFLVAGLTDEIAMVCKMFFR